MKSLLKTPPLLSVIIPVYNEKNTILEILRRVRDVKIEKEIIIVDDSTDETREILKNIKDENIQVIFNKKRLGKGAAVRKGFSLAKGDIVIIQDADMEYSPSDYHKLIQPIIEGKADVVFGSRVFSKGAKSNLRYYIGGKFLSFLASLLYNVRITDASTCYKVMKRDVLEKLSLRSSGFDLDFEIVAKVAKQGKKIYEVPISYMPRPRKEGKKIKVRDGFKAVFTLLYYRFMS